MKPGNDAKQPRLAYFVEGSAGRGLPVRKLTPLYNDTETAKRAADVARGSGYVDVNVRTKKWRA